MSALPFREPLNVFNIPPEVLSGLTLRPSPLAILETPLSDVASPTEGQELESPLSQLATSSLTCALCHGATFSSVDEQRNHWKSDWHRYNVQLRIQDLKSEPISEEKFGHMVEGLDESSSGTESEDSDTPKSSAEDAVSTLLNKNLLKQRHRSPSPEYWNHQHIPKAPILWYHSPNIPNKQFGIYHTIFPPRTSPETSVCELVDMQNGGDQGRLWALFMVAGGHFSGMVVQVKPPLAPLGNEKKKKSNAPPKPDMEIIKQGSVHRYTTRRKQGGSQSVNDNAKGPAKSAGAQLRRYGEQALREDIRALLEEWRQELDLSERIFIRASVANRKIFMDFEGTPIKKSDSRLRTFPFPTRRPNHTELIRCLAEITRVKVTHLTDEELKARDQAILDSLPKPKPLPKTAPTPTSPVSRQPKLPKLSKDEDLIQDKWRRLVDMVRKGRIDALKSFWEREAPSLASGNPDTKLPDWLDSTEGAGGGWTLLQLASFSGQDEVVQWLLVDLQSNPCIPLPLGAPSSVITTDGANADSDAPASGAQGTTRRTAYDIASTKQTRDVFRRCAWAHPERWDWLGAARVPSALSPAMEEAQEKKKSEKWKGLREKARERETAKLKEQVDPSIKAPVSAAASPRPKTESSSGPQKLGGAAAIQKEKQTIVGLTPEMRAKIERERRARAAEARLKGA